MKRNFVGSVVVFVLGLALCFVGTLPAGAGVYYYGDNFGFGYEVRDSSASSSLSTDSGIIQYVSASANSSRYGWDSTTGTSVKIPNGGYINFNYGGAKTAPTETKNSVGQNLSVSIDGWSISEGVYSSVFDANSNWGGGKGLPTTDVITPILPPHLFSEASSFFNGSFIVDGSAQAYYNEYVMQGPDGIAGETRFSAYVEIPVLWDTGVSVGMMPMASIGSPTVVPEPAALGLLVASGFGLLLRRRKQQ